MLRRTVCYWAALTAKDIEDKLLKSETLKPTSVSVVDASAGCGSFFNIKISSAAFDGKTLIQQHRLVNAELKEEIKGIHGFTLDTSKQ
ncbi:conserved eukaryotic protein [Angomonas deanei]|uniref:BolA-like protein, putative n=1 Tax=Angomonas deanei TaxID=59799 RepID=S9WUT1_9TRYP|nr:conserved eukaryotic protein [Angomonas deanei]EPY42243.1 conserved eukaryotic protein [Angomonas deanei]CAD2219738.1 BolA-like protein, putative [Angomonas deanei]|eukprot:EPY39915.1 conserved eukaryotic protein [Angomonas deanei]